MEMQLDNDGKRDTGDFDDPTQPVVRLPLSLASFSSLFGMAVFVFERVSTTLKHVDFCMELVLTGTCGFSRGQPPDLGFGLGSTLGLPDGFVGTVGLVGDLGGRLFELEHTPSWQHWPSTERLINA